MKFACGFHWPMPYAALKRFFRGGSRRVVETPFGVLGQAK
jgi:hypothetical protein